jgi:hypothetical protein
MEQKILKVGKTAATVGALLGKKPFQVLSYRFDNIRLGHRDNLSDCVIDVKCPMFCRTENTQNMRGMTLAVPEAVTIANWQHQVTLPPANGRQFFGLRFQ